MKLTPALKAHAVKFYGVKSGATDAEFIAAVSAALVGGKLQPKKLKELQGGGEPPAKKGNNGQKKVDTSSDDFKKAVDAAVNAAVGTAVDAAVKKFNMAGGGDSSGGSRDNVPTPQKMFSDGLKVRVKSAAESYSASRKSAVVPMVKKSGELNGRSDAGSVVSYMNKPLDHPSDLDKATAGAWVKWCIKHSYNGPIPQNARLTDHDADLVLHALHNGEWSGAIKGGSHEFHRKKLDEFEIKGVLDDTVSGGIEATPVVFDEAIILIPLLFGELFPNVSVTNLSRGRRVKSATQQNPTLQSGTGEGSAIAPFNTAGLISAFDTPINVASGAMEIGLDFEEDSPVDIGGNVIQKYGEQALAYFDRVIAVGNGYNEPQGLFNTLGVAYISSDNMLGGGPTLADYEALMFGVAKQWRTEAGAMCCYVGNDTTYRRARQIPVGPGDTRRILGLTHGDYTVLEKPFKIQASIPNNLAAFVNLKRYRLYRRLGMTFRVETAGRTLALSNQKLIVGRLRCGGQMENAGAMAIINNMQQ